MLITATFSEVHSDLFFFYIISISFCVRLIHYYIHSTTFELTSLALHSSLFLRTSSVFEFSKVVLLRLLRTWCCWPLVVLRFSFLLEASSAIIMTKNLSLTSSIIVVFILFLTTHSIISSVIKFIIDHHVRLG